MAGLGFVIVAIQLLILFRLYRHATVVDLSDLAAPMRDAVKQQQQMSMKNEIKRQKRIITRPTDTRKPDGSFNGIDVYYTPEPMDSTVSCVGENYQDNAWMYRSCHFTHFCFDMEEKDYVLFQSPQEREWAKHLRNDLNIGTSSTMHNMTVALGGLNPKWMQQAFQKLEWFPKVVPSELNNEGYYELPASYVWVPFHSFAGFNAGHIICECKVLFWVTVFLLLSLLTFT